jgi:hypothetical protein
MPKQPLTGPDAGPWCELVERISGALRPSTAYAVRALLVTLCEHSETFTPEQRAAAGAAARRLLDFAWTSGPRDPWLVGHAIESVCRTFGSDPVASAGLLRRALEQPHLAEHGFEELSRLAREIKRLRPIDPHFVEEVYRAAFAHREESREATPMGTSRILPLISNRQQDYQSGLHLLAEAFPEFLAKAAAPATRTLIHVVAAYVSTHHAYPGHSEEAFDFDGREAWIRQDNSVSWDAGDLYRHDEPVRMLNAFERDLEALAQWPEAPDRLQEILEVVVRENRLAVVWRRLLRVGARFPGTLGKALLPLVRSAAVLTRSDTSHLAGELLRAVFPGLTPSERAQVEQALLSIPDAMPPQRREAGERARARLLGCLPEADLVLDETRHLVSELRAASAIPPNVSGVQFGTGWSTPYGEEEYLADEGVPVETEPNRTIRELERPVREFADRHLNSVPTPEEVETLLPSLQALRTALARADEDGVHQKQRDYAWGVLTRACARVAWIAELSCEEASGNLVRTVLLDASAHPEPRPDAEHDAQFDEHPSWGGPAARIAAAEGAVLLARHSDCGGPDLLQAVERLSRDPVPAVRFQIARPLNALARTAPDLMWRMIERMCRDEASRGVLQGLLAGPLASLGPPHPDRVVGLVRQVLERTSEGRGARQVRDLCVDILTSLHLWRDHPAAREIISSIVDRPATSVDDAHRILSHLREPLTHGPVAPPDPRQDAVRGRALDLVTRLLRSARTGWREVGAAHGESPFGAWPEADRELVRGLARLMDNIGIELYFASGAYDLGKGADAKSAPEPRVRERFYREVGPLLDELADIGLPSVTHHILETLETFISMDPQGVFLRIGRVVRGGSGGGYQYEQLAADLLVKLVEWYLAEHRALFREDAACRQALLEILDIFVRAGWPSARQLTYRLDEIFR